MDWNTEPHSETLSFLYTKCFLNVKGTSLSPQRQIFPYLRFILFRSVCKTFLILFL